VDSTARIWSRDGKPLATLQGHTGSVRSAVFAPDGGRILTASSDGTARLWDRNGNPLATLQGHTGRVNSAVFAPDGGHILTASSDGTARLWEAFPETQTLIDRVKAEVPRCLTPEQRQRFFLPPTPPRWCAAMHKWPYDLGSAQELADAELEDPILRGIDKNDSVARSLQFQQGPLSLDYWTRLDVFIALALGVLAVLALSRRTRRTPPPVVRISQTLDRSLRQAVAFAEERHHGGATSEHLLLALIDDPDVTPVMRACHVDIEAVRRAISSSLAVQGTVPESASVEPHAGIQAVLQRAIERAIASGNREVNGARVLVEMFTEPVGELLRQVGMTRLDAVNYISHGIIGHHGFGETPAAGREPAIATGPEMLEVKLLNDDFTPMEFVVDVLQRIFDYNPKDAVQVMLDIHRNGVGACGTYPSDVARFKAAQVQEYARGHEHPLRCVLGQP
jgi:ATP-dependent Clp protease adapter protein ClpS